jgi:hypothetical protein
VKKTDKPILPEHPDALLLPYVESLLDPESKAQVEEHLGQCAECSSNVDDLRRLVGVLKTNRSAFCPKPLELYLYAGSGKDPTGVLQDHVDQCGRCADELREYKEHVRGEVMAPELWQEIKDRLPEPARHVVRTSDVEREHASFRERVFSWLRTPVVAAAAVAAVLLVVFLYPREMPEQAIGLSSIAWEAAPRPKAGSETPRKAVAYLIIFKNLKTAFSQAQVDSLYQALQPDIELSERYRILTPADVKKALAGKGRRASDGNVVPGVIGKDLGVESLLVITLTPRDDKFAVHAELFDVNAGTRLREKTIDAVAASDLPARIRESASALML